MTTSLGAIHKGYPILGWVGVFSKIGYCYAETGIKIEKNQIWVVGRSKNLVIFNG